MLDEDIEAHIEVQQTIHMRDPDTLCADLDPEFNIILSYLNSFNAKKRPDYRYVKRQLLNIKERNNLSNNLEWA